MTLNGKNNKHTVQVKSLIFTYFVLGKAGLVMGLLRRSVRPSVLMNGPFLGTLDFQNS